MKSLLSLCVICFLSFIQFQCENATIQPGTDEILLDLPFTPSTHEISNLINQGYTEEIIRLYERTYLLAKSLQDIYENKDYSYLILESYLKKEVPYIPFSNLRMDADFNLMINEKLDAKLNSYIFKGTSQISNSNAFFSTFLLQDKQHEPIVNFINPETADLNYPPIISPGIEVPDEPEKGIVDCIVAWFEDDYGTKHQIVIGEEEALQSKWPVFVISSIAKQEECIFLLKTDTDS